MSDTKIAVYWDFENLHISLVPPNTNGGSRQQTNSSQEKLLNIEVIMDYVVSLGDVVINRAYNNWQFYGAYRKDLLTYAIDLIQLYPKGSHAKNGADIRLALDALEDTYQHSHITHVVIIGGDSDYISVAQKLKKLGKVVIGVSIQGAANLYWTRSCNEFKLYETLLVKSNQPTEAEPQPLTTTNKDFSPAKAILVKAIQHLMAEEDTEGILKAKVRPMMVRLDPEFDPGNYNFPTFNAFLAACSDVIKTEKGENDLLISLVKKPKKIKPAKEEPDSVSPEIAKAKALLIKTLGTLMTESSSDKVQKGKVRPAMLLIDPGFKLSSLGFTTFNQFLSTCSDLIKEEKGEHDSYLMLISGSVPETKTIKKAPNTGKAKPVKA